MAGGETANEAKEGRLGGGSITAARLVEFSAAVTRMPFCESGLGTIVSREGYSE